MIHSGPIPLPAHQIGDYLLGVLLIAAPFLLAFDSGAATAVAIVLGVVVLVLAASTDGPLSLVNAVPIPLHIVMDLGAGVLAIAAPFLFGFSDETEPTVFFIAFGILELLVVVGTRFPRQTRAIRTA